MLLTLGLRGLRQENQEFKAILDNIVIPYLKHNFYKFSVITRQFVKKNSINELTTF